MSLCATVLCLGLLEPLPLPSLRGEALETGKAPELRRRRGDRELAGSGFSRAGGGEAGAAAPYLLSLIRP